VDVVLELLVVLGLVGGLDQGDLVVVAGEQDLDDRVLIVADAVEGLVELKHVEVNGVPTKF